jgi:ATP-dependent RNA helicase DDX3X
MEHDLFGDAKKAGEQFQSYDIPVKTSGRDVPDAIEDFDSALIHPDVMENIIRTKYTTPTPGQKHAIPIISAQRDLMVSAQTGSGKTAAFLIPMVSELLKHPPAPPMGSRSTPSVLVLSPTRELCQQIFKDARRFSFKTTVRPVVAYGGAPIRDQIQEVKQGCDILVATPGRLVDLMERGLVSLANIRFLCLDEADRMLDMGFEPQIRRIVEQADMPVDGRQTLLFSATFPTSIQRMASDFLYDHVFLAVGITGSTTKNITQRLELVEYDAKTSLLLDLLHSVEGLTIIFVETKRMADQLEYYLEREGFPATSIHGDRDQREREQAIRTFKSGETPYLVATDVASRGLDIPNVTHVINYELPKEIDTYVHRIGRTARAGNTGLATSFMNQRDANMASKLLELLAESKQEIPAWLESMSAQGPRRSRHGGHKWGAEDIRQESSRESWGIENSPSYQTRTQAPRVSAAVASKAKPANNYWD